MGNYTGITVAKLSLDIENNPEKYPLKDMSNLKASEKLDIVLGYMKTIKEPPFQTLYEIKTRLRAQGYSFGKYSDELTRILKKLEKDEFIYTEPESETSKVSKYYFTFEGDSLLEIEKGYTGKLATQNANAVLERNNEKYLRYGAVGAAIFSGFYFLLELVKYCESHHWYFFCP